MSSSNMTKAQVYVAAFVVTAAIVGSYFFPKSETITQMLAGSAAGSTFSTSKIASMSVQTATDTVFTMLNTDTSDRVITSEEISLTGGAATSSTYAFNCATSSTASGLGGNSNFILNQTLGVNFGTSTGSSLLYVASTSPGITGTTTISVSSVAGPIVNQFARIWKTGTYLVCKNTNSSSYNAANTVDSSTTGTVTFKYNGQ